ncbi:MAG: T9SS type A sorting domain-containing protein [Bacteroidia bacterium]|nr:T9SS type A sorting domain-containing protein [Bacteroidia bacterium]
MKKNILFYSFATAFFMLSVFASGQTTWEKLFSRKNTDAFRSAVEVPSGGYILTGYTSDSTVSDTDAYVVRMTNAGDTLWTKRINGANSRKDLLYKVINTDDGGFAFCGYTTDNGVGNDDAYFLKTDANGVVQWSKYWGGAGKDRAQDIQQTLDGGYVLVGYTTSAPSIYYDAFMIRTNSVGDTLWTKRYGTGAAFDDANSVVQLPDSGFVLGGQSTNGGNALDMFFQRTNKTGDTLWTKKFGTIGTDNIEKILRLSDGSFMLAGGSDGPGFGGNDGVVVKTDSGGTVLWTKNYGGNSQDDFHQINHTLDGGFILSGTTRSSGPFDPNLWIVKTTANGDSIWSRTYGGDNNDHGYCAIATSDGGYLTVGYTGSFAFNAEEAYVIKSNGIGEVGNLLTYVTVSALTRPLNESCVANDFQVRVVVRNYGLDTVPNVPVTIQITGPHSQTINATYNGAVYPGDLDTLAFSTLINLSTPGQYTFSCTSTLVNDVFPQNNNLTTTVTINTPPVINLGLDTIEISFGQSVVLDAGPGFTSYNWSTGATTRTVEISTTSLVFVTAVSGSNCLSRDTVFVNQVVGIDDISHQVKVNIYPNPSTGRVDVDIEQYSPEVEFRVYDIIGNEIFFDTHIGKGSYTKSIDLKSEPKGVYFLQLRTNDGVLTKRILLQ